MFAGFNLKIEDDSFLKNGYYDIGKKILNSNKTIIEKGLKKYICEEGQLNGTAIQEDWFPQIDADIFISHSHQDEKMVVSFAGWLYKIFGLTAFVDSCIWGYADDLLKIIDNEYCIQSKDGSNTTYDYKLRNSSTSHVHMMLSIALSKMIDKTECLFFINTPNSIVVSNSINNRNSTLSPWIFAELQISRIARRRLLQEYRGKLIEKKAKFENKQMIIKYDVPTKHLKDLNDKDLIHWSEIWEQIDKDESPFPLDYLYWLKFEELFPQILNG